MARIVVTGSSGLVGRRLIAEVESAGGQVHRLVRSASDQPRSFAWDPMGGTVDATAFAGCDAVVHLAGEGIADKRWNDAQMQKIRDSRVIGTRTLVQALTALSEKPKVLVCASAIGFYGDRGSSELTEESTAGEGFLAEVCQAWEAEAKPAADAGIRVVHLRIGVVLSADGGALAKMLPPFKLGAGGVLGSGKQYMSWIDRDDLVGIIRFAIAQERPQRSGQRGGAGRGDQSGIYQDAGAGAGPPDDLPSARTGGPVGLRQDGRRAAAGQHAGRAHQVAAGGLWLSVSRPGGFIAASVGPLKRQLAGPCVAGCSPGLESFPGLRPGLCWSFRSIAFPS
jgi:uncharacterized protein (TIGR01777 family)